MEALQRVKRDGYGVAISELETELDYLRRAKRYFLGTIQYLFEYGVRFLAT
jgi:hypothetical protein